MLYGNILILLLVISTGAKKLVGKKLVCQQEDQSFDAPKGYCTVSKEGCSCKEDCIEYLSKKDCVCRTNDLVNVQSSELANCSVWTQDAWKEHIKTLRKNVGFKPITPGNFLGGNILAFPVRNQGMAWPITRPSGSEVLAVHGSHCLHMVKMFNGVIKQGRMLKDHFDRSHADHCRRLLRRVFAFYTEVEKEYKVQPASLCEDIRMDYNDIHVTPLQQVSPKGWRVSYGGSVSYGGGKRSLDSQVNTYSPSYVYRTLYEKAKREENATIPSQNAVFDLISGHNLGNLIVKDWLELPMTPQERDLIQEWESDHVVRMAAFGIYCVDGNGQKAPIDTIRNVLLMKE